MKIRLLLDNPLGETLLSPGVALTDFLPGEEEGAAALRQRAEAALSAGQGLGEVAGGALRIEPLLRCRTAGARRTPGAEDMALDGWRVSLRLTLTRFRLGGRLLPGLAEKDGGALSLTPGLTPGAPFPLTWLGETPGGLMSLTLPQALPTGPLTLSLAEGGRMEVAFEGLEGFALRLHHETD